MGGGGREPNPPPLSIESAKGKKIVNSILKHIVVLCCILKSLALLGLVCPWPWPWILDAVLALGPALKKNEVLGLSLEI